MNTISNNRKSSSIVRMLKGLALCALCTSAATFTSCDDMLTKESDYYLYAEKEHLATAADTVNSVLGIVNKLQNIAVRTVLFGEVRADLDSLTDIADINLRELADNNVSDNNKYNAPGDYYAVINNCNYFLAHADSCLTNTANDTIFRKEMDAVRVVRAWTYLQLATTYGSVPLVTSPILSQTEAEEWEAKPKSDLLAICDYFINDLANNYRSDEFPNYGRIDDHINPLLVFFPRLVVLGDYYLWRNALTGDVTDAKNAALCYYQWISNTQVPGRTSFLTSKANYISWPNACFEKNDFDYSPSSSDYYGSITSYGNENITFIPMDSASNQSNYNQLRVLFNSRSDNNYTAAIVPSSAMRSISRAQTYCGYLEDQQLSVYPSEADITSYWDDPMMYGDLRYYMTTYSSNNVFSNGERISNYFLNYKQNYANICIYRTGMIYLRMAEALNAAGFPSFASTILTWGLSNYSIEEGVLPYLTTTSDSAFVRTFNFPNDRYFVYNQPGATNSNINMTGIHSRGSGNTYRNERYFHSAYADAPEYEPYVMSSEDSTKLIEQYPDDYLLRIKAYIDSMDLVLYPKFVEEKVKPYYADAKSKEQNTVDSLIQIEWALEECFEGTRFYNLMRADYRQRKQNIGWTANPLSVAVARRNPSVAERLKDENNWFISWQGKIGR